MEVNSAVLSGSILAYRSVLLSLNQLFLKVRPSICKQRKYSRVCRASYLWRCFALIGKRPVHLLVITGNYVTVGSTIGERGKWTEPWCASIRNREQTFAPFGASSSSACFASVTFTGFLHFWKVLLRRNQLELLLCIRSVRFPCIQPVQPVQKLLQPKSICWN